MALRSNVIASTLEVVDQEMLAGELRQIRDLQTSGAMLGQYEEITTGDPVKLTDGVFKGYAGVVGGGQDEMRLVVSISLIRRSVLVDVSRDGVAP